MSRCTTLGCQIPGTVTGIYDDGDTRQRVTYCADCAQVLSGEFTPDTPAPRPAGKDAGRNLWRYSPSPVESRAAALAAERQRGREEMAREVREGDRLTAALRIHHPIMRSETGPFSGCRCGAVKLGQDVIRHVVEELTAALADRNDEREGQ